ncbi:MAG: hypothetical protein H7145_12705 [Akkermansiaceae bacterium]|nr:hypothetical protein [Armatimonadota bacterium]
MSANAFWNIAFGAYRFAVNRGDLTYRLQETETGTLWADGVCLGTIEIIERETATATRYSFGDLKLISLSEKSGATGKRILFGLDAPGRIPVDVYLTCTEREIQLTVEASRDTKTHQVGEIVLFPGLCAVAEDGESHLVIPHREGIILRAEEAPEGTTPLRIWEGDTGLTMPFVGAVRVLDAGVRSALALLTDSAYGVADLSRAADSAQLDLRYARDPERRRLDMRVVLMPGGDHVSIARAYRDRIIGEGGHVTLRKKTREKPALVAWLDGDETAAVVRRQVTLPPDKNRWIAMEEAIQDARDNVPKNTVYIADLCGDWTVPFVDAWRYVAPPRFGVAVPLLGVVHHDATPLCFDTLANNGKSFLRALLYLAPPVPPHTPPSHVGVLHPLHALSFGAFLTEHRFLTPDSAVEEARYSNGARIVINGSAVEDYETEELHLPPLGFLAAHPQMIAYYALRVKEETFDEPAWRVQKSQDGKRLEESAVVQRYLFGLGGELRSSAGSAIAQGAPGVPSEHGE